MSRGYWAQPAKWARMGPARVFCASMSDVFDKRGPGSERTRLWQVIRDTPQLEWLLLTKRPQNIRRYAPSDWPLPNVRLGVTTENQEEADRRLAVIAELPHRLAPFVSAEPLIAPVDLSAYLHLIGWVIVGGESGPRFRQMRQEWPTSIRDQCQEVGVPFFFKQWGGRTPKAGGAKLVGRHWREFPPILLR